MRVLCGGFGCVRLRTVFVQFSVFGGGGGGCYLFFHVLLLLSPFSSSSCLSFFILPSPPFFLHLIIHLYSLFPFALLRLAILHIFQLFLLVIIHHHHHLLLLLPYPSSSFLIVHLISLQIVLRVSLFILPLCSVLLFSSCLSLSSYCSYSYSSSLSQKRAQEGGRKNPCPPPGETRRRNHLL